MSNLPIEKNDILLVDDTLYRVVGDYHEVNTKLDFELESIKNQDDWFMCSLWDVSENLGTNWKKVKIEK